MLALVEVATEIVTLLKAGSVNTLVGGRIYDYVPDNKQYPYVTVQEVSTDLDWTHDRDGEQLRITVDIWSRYRGFKEAATIAAAVRAELAGVAHALTSFDANSIPAEALALRDPDGITRHIPMDFRFWARSKAA